MGVWHVDNAQVAPVLALADGDSSPVVSGTISRGRARTSSTSDSETRPRITCGLDGHAPCRFPFELSLNQQALSALHRLRSAWLAARTARINTVRGLLREFGVAIPLGSKRVVPRVRELVQDDDSTLPDCVKPALKEAQAEILDLERRIRSIEHQLRALARQLPVIRKLRTIPGVGLITATAFVAFVGDVARFQSARHFSSYLGLPLGNGPAVYDDGSEPSASAETSTFGRY